MEALWPLMFIPVAWPIVAKLMWKDEISPQEFVINLVCGCMIALGIFAAGRMSQTSDEHILNGEVVRKDQVEVSCSHSYPCNCREICSGSGEERSCYTHCDTCYYHDHDYDWRVYTNINGRTFNIARVDWQGVTEPKRYTAVRRGQPVAMSEGFINYIKAVPESLYQFAKTKDDNLPPVPAYPKIYDYHYADRVVGVQIAIPDRVVWNEYLAEALKSVPHRLGANVVILFAATTDRDYRYKVEKAWIGAKNNDVVLVIGTLDFKKIEFVEVVTWARNKNNEMFEVVLRDALRGAALTPAGIIDPTMEVMEKHFRPVNPGEFAYLKNDIQPPLWVLILAFLLSAVVSIGLSWFFKNNDDTTYI